jgi:hypothetical protein
MKKLFKILFFFNAAFCVCGEWPIPVPGLKSITIEHTGEQDSFMDIIIINTHKNGLIADYFNINNYYIRVQDAFFDKIVELINENRELFSENHMGGEYGCFRLFIENEDDGEKYYYYLNKREKSLLFFRKLYEMVNMERNYNTFKRRLEILINEIDR